MEPHLIDYYNDIPQGINVIDKMNEELDELQKKYLDLEKIHEEYIKSGSKIITVINFYSQVEYFCFKNNVDILDDNIIYKMIKEGYSFINIPPSRLKNSLAELRVMLFDGEHLESKIIIGDWFKLCPYCEKKQVLEGEDYNLNNDSE